MKYLLAISAIICWGIWATIDKKLTGMINTWTIMIYYTLSSLIISPFYLYMNRGETISTFNSKAFGLTFLSVALNHLAGLAFVQLLKTEDVGWSSVATSSYPLITVILGIIFFGEKLTLNFSIGLLLVLTGLYFINK